MKNLFAVLSLLSCAALFSGAAHADDQLALAKAKNCLACHDVKLRKVGPSYTEVAKKYAGDAEAPARLSKKVREGGVGVWGKVPMPVNKVTEAEADALVQWVLSLK